LLVTDLARAATRSGVVPEHAHLDLDPADELLDEHLLVVLERERDGLLELALVVRLRDPDRRAERAGLTNTG
jgi:hypothetical protein